MLESDYRPLCPVRLPYAERQRYMHSFDLADPRMADGFEDYLEPVVGLCRSAGAVRGTAHMTVDEKLVLPGMSQRRPRPHVDGRFVVRLASWSHDPSPDDPPTDPDDPDRLPSPGGWLHYCNDIGAGPARRMAVIVAASVAGCRAWRGRFDGKPASDGDLSHIAGQLGQGEILPADIGYLLSPDCVHESMIFDRPVRRSFLRIALPVEFDFPY